MNYGLKGRVVAVTGGASGIGRSTVLALARDGAKVAIIDLQARDVESTVAEAKATGAHAVGYCADIRDAKGLGQAADAIENQLGPVGGLIACAGIAGVDSAETLSEQDWSNVLSVNVTGMFLSCQEFGNRMIKRRNGAIVAIGSIYGLGGVPGRTHYVTSKFAVHGLVRNLALEWGRYGVRVNCVAPGPVDTPMLRRSIPTAFIRDVFEDRSPLGRIAKSEELATASLMLLSDACSYVTGVVLPVDGGLTTGYFTHMQGADLSSNRLLAAGVYAETGA